MRVYEPLAIQSVLFVTQGTAVVVLFSVKSSCVKVSEDRANIRT